MSHWAKNKEFSTGYFRLWLLLKIYKIFGRSILKIIIFPIVAIAFFFMKNARLASCEYFSALYEFTKDKKYKPNGFKIFKHIYTFAEALIDRTAGWTGDIKTNSLDYKNQEDIEKFIRNINSKKGMVLICSHLGNVDILRAIASDESVNIRANAFMEVNHTQAFNAFIEKTNPNARLNLYSTLDIGIETAFEIKEKLDGGEICVIAGDRVAIMNEKESFEKTFLGKPAKFPKGAFRFAKMMECDFCFLAICSNKDKFDVYLKFFDWEEAKKQNKIIDEYIGWLQNLVLQYPYQWYNFYDFWG